MFILTSQPCEEGAAPSYLLLRSLRSENAPESRELELHQVCLPLISALRVLPSWGAACSPQYTLETQSQACLGHHTTDMIA